MRHKKRPVKSSRSVTFIIDGHTSFGNKNSQINEPPTQELTETVHGDYQSNRKQFESDSTRHMSDVMRLAFLENNDISTEDYSNIDFNAMSSASILQRNIQQHLQQQRLDQIRLRQQQQLQNRYHRQQQQFQPDDSYSQLLLHNEIDDDQDYDITDSRIFATATPNLTNSRSNLSHIATKTARGNSGSRARNSASASTSKSVRQETDANGFLCDEPGCGKSFPSLRKLRHHKVVHSDEFPFVCEFKGCSKKFKRKFGIDLHSTTHFDLDPEMYSKTSNNSSLPFFGRRMQYSMCKPCDQKFKTVHEYQFHMLKVHNKEPFKCPVKDCGQTFGIWKSFQKHRASHYFNYYCKMDPQCNHHTSNLQLLKLHIYCCHFRQKLIGNVNLNTKDKRVVKADINSIEEPSDDEQEGHATDYSMHNRNAKTTDDQGHEVEKQEPTVVTPRRDSRLRKNPPRSSAFGQQDYAAVSNGASFVKSISTTPNTKRNRPSTTPSVSKTTSQAEKRAYDDLKNEDYDNSDNRIFDTTTPTSTCKINSSITSRSGPSPSIKSGTSRLDSSLTSNTSKRRAKATIQQLDVSSQDELEETIHKHGGGFLCDEPDCGKSFPSLRKLRHHKVVHSDEFPFVCEFKGCSKKFKRKFGIDLHSTTHFDLDPEMYSKTSNNSSLPFFGRRMQYSMCRPCDQKFRTVHEYQFHMLKHNKEPFKCPVKGCGQTFGIWKSFQKHRASHYFNYYCKMDPQCNHHTSNLQLLKLHIYCCHFRRHLPENATLTSRDQEVEPESDPIKDELPDIEDVDDSFRTDESKNDLDKSVDDQSMHIDEDDEKQEEQKPEVQTTRRDSRLRKNPPRSSAFGQQDYASVNNGSSFARSLSLTPQSRRTRASISTAGSQTAPPQGNKLKLPQKVLPKRSAQRLPMSLLADDGSTEDDDVHSSIESESEQFHDEDETDRDRAPGTKFKCHLCDYKFSVRFQLTKHLSTHLELTPSMYLATADKQVVQLSERRRREFYCDKCNVKFENTTELDTHMQKHGNRPYICHFCPVPSTFRLAKQYLSHLYEHRFQYKCTMDEGCDFVINRKDALKLHIFRMHLKQQLPPYIENFANMIEC